mmetsp:Transcript_40574/g.75047  ORF Transcript_40574/g.75047 Transcript_40574/m.75047 type:complete len:298 (-) Transcript_40574:379-1272(-)
MARRAAVANTFVASSPQVFLRRRRATTSCTEVIGVDRPPSSSAPKASSMSDLRSPPRSNRSGLAGDDDDDDADTVASAAPADCPAATAVEGISSMPPVLPPPPLLLLLLSRVAIALAVLFVCAVRAPTSGEASLAAHKAGAVAARTSTKLVSAAGGVAWSPSTLPTWSPPPWRPWPLSAWSAPSTKCVARPAPSKSSLPDSRVPVTASHKPTLGEQQPVRRKCKAPASGRRPMLHSGMANRVRGVATRVCAAIHRPAPAPMTMPSAKARTGMLCLVCASSKRWWTLYSSDRNSTCSE